MGIGHRACGNILVTLEGRQEGQEAHRVRIIGATCTVGDMATGGRHDNQRMRQAVYMLPVRILSLSGHVKDDGRTGRALENKWGCARDVIVAN